MICGHHYVQESFEVSPLQDDHDIILPWWWTLKHSTPYLLTGRSQDLIFDSPKCINCTKEAVSEFTIEYADSVATFCDGSDWVGCIGSLREVMTGKWKFILALPFPHRLKCCIPIS